jgi:hypothetical protein
MPQEHCFIIVGRFPIVVIMKICISLSSDFPTVFGANIGPSPNVKKVLFFPISWGKIPNSMVIKLFVKIVHESFFK